MTPTEKLAAALALIARMIGRYPDKPISELIDGLVEDHADGGDISELISLEDLESLMNWFADHGY